MNGKVIICLGKDTYEIAESALCDKQVRVNNFYEALNSERNYSEFELLETNKTVRIYGVSHCGNYGVRNPI